MSCRLAPAKTVFPGWGRVPWGGPGGVIFDVVVVSHVVAKIEDLKFPE